MKIITQVNFELHDTKDEQDNMGLNVVNEQDQVDRKTTKTQDNIKKTDDKRKNEKRKDGSKKKKKFQPSEKWQNLEVEKDEDE